MDRSRFRRLAVLLISLVALLCAGAGPASADVPPLQVAQPCDSPTTTFAKGYVGLVYVDFEMQPSKICAQVSDPTGLVNRYFVVDVQQPSVSGNPPSVDTSGDACVANHGTKLFEATGPAGLIRVSEYAEPGSVWVCLEAAGLSERVIVPVLPVITGVRLGAVDPAPAPPAYTPWPSAPSSKCVDGGGLLLVDGKFAGTSLWVAEGFSRTEGPIDLCVRAEQSSGGGVGGVLTIPYGSVVNWLPVSSDMTPCDTQVTHIDAPVYLHIDSSSDPNKPTSVCISTWAIALRVSAGTGAPPAPLIWTPDPGTPGTP